MDEPTASPTGPASNDALDGLRNLRRALLHLHKALLDGERTAYEWAHGQVSSGELLQLVINHEQFAWLRAISELIVRIDEALDADETLTTSAANGLMKSASTLLKPSETGSEFERKFFIAIQSNPDAVLSYKEVRRLLPPQD